MFLGVRANRKAAVNIATKRFAVVAFLLLASVGLFIVTEHLANSDPSRIPITEYIRQSDDVLEKVGLVENADLVRRVAVGPDGPQGHRIYTFMVSGPKATVTVVVRADKLGDQGRTEQYSVESIEP
jgi:hypothetical protein